MPSPNSRSITWRLLFRIVPGSRHTWHLVPVTPESAAPPTSTTAENFYKTPWTANNKTIEQIIEVPEMSETMSEGIPTARPLTAQLLAEASRPNFFVRFLMRRSTDLHLLEQSSKMRSSPMRCSETTNLATLARWKM